MVKSRNPLILMVGPGGFEPPTSTVSRALVGSLTFSGYYSPLLLLTFSTSSGGKAFLINLLSFCLSTAQKRHN